VSPALLCRFSINALLSVKPVNYQLSLYDLEFLGNWSYQGTVKIDLEVLKSAKEIVLNANQLVIHSAALSTEDAKTEQAIKASNISYNKDAQRATLSFDQEFGTASKAVLEIKFQGTMNNVSATHPALLSITNSDPSGR
jgi:hypothetical protein